MTITEKEMGEPPLRGLEVKVARAIANGLGDNLDLAFLSKSSWTHAKGIAVDGSFRDINAPLRGDYMEAARAALDVISRERISGALRRLEQSLTLLPVIGTQGHAVPGSSNINGEK